MFWQKQPESAKKKENYKVVKKLGEGTYGVVKEVTHIPTKRNYALKAIKKKPLQNNPRALEVVQREMTLLKGLPPHRNIISLFETFETNDKFYLAFELATGGELFERISAKGKFTEKDAAEIVFEILDGISYLHAHNIVHRDLKPENILYKSSDPNSDIVIADFGVANIVQGEDQLRTLCGSPAYAAPEVIRRSGHGRSADIWSIGVIAFTLLMGYGPWYYCEDVPSMFEAITHGRWKFESPYVDNVSTEGRTFIKKLMQLNPKNRPTARQAMIDPWLVKYSRRANDYARKARDAQILRKSTVATAAAATVPVVAAPAVPAAGGAIIPDRRSSKAAIAGLEAIKLVTPGTPSSSIPAPSTPPPKTAPLAGDEDTSGSFTSAVDSSFPLDTPSTSGTTTPPSEPIQIFSDISEPFIVQQNPDSPFVKSDGALHDDLADLNFGEELTTAIDGPVVDDSMLPNLAGVSPDFDPRRKFRRAAKIIGTLKMMEKIERLKVGGERKDGKDEGGSSDEDEEFVLASN
ncbi:hypothetical protein HDU67_005951 [Dinochytrium kinnereticum]|nr:hypothetical protein HDU67_005951 [Dinochytrium kinnereticum]